jgi:hypothetical protein
LSIVSSFSTPVRRAQSWWVMESQESSASPGQVRVDNTPYESQGSSRGCRTLVFQIGNLFNYEGDGRPEGMRRRDEDDGFTPGYSCLRRMGVLAEKPLSFLAVRITRASVP